VRIRKPWERESVQNFKLAIDSEVTEILKCNSRKTERERERESERERERERARAHPRVDVTEILKFT